MQHDKQKLFSLAAIAVAAVLFGMVISGGLDLTSPADADKPAETVNAPAMVGSMVPDFAALADRVVPSVVSVFSTDVEEPEERQQRPRDPFHFFFGPRQDQDQDEPTVRRSSGSGFFITADGELLTNFHVVEDADKIEIETVDETRYECEVIGRDPETDLALLKVIEPDRDFPVLPLGDAEALRVGEWVMAVGNPLNMDFTVTVGVVSAKGRVLGLSDSSFENFIQTDAAINFGNSGGPLVNLRGETVGINTAINARGQNLGFAVPVNIAKRILPQLRQRGKVVRGYLGVLVQNLDQDLVEAFGLPSRDGAFVEEVLKGHAADKGGLKPGDVVVEVDGTPIKTTRELIDLVSSMPPETKVELEVIREGKHKTIEIVLEERIREDNLGELEEVDTEESATTERTGLTVSDLSSRTRQFYGVDEDKAGVVVTHVRAVSPAGEKGLVRGDVITAANGTEVDSVESFSAEVKAVAEGGILRLYIYRPRADRSFFAILKLEE